MSSYTLSQAIRIFLDSHKPTTRKSYEYPLRFMQDFIGDDPPLEAVQPEDLTAFVRDYSEREAVTSPATVNKTVKTLRTFFNWCVKMDFIKKSPARVLKQKQTRKYVRRDKAISEHEVQIVLQNCRNLIESDTLDTRGKLVNVDHFRNYSLILFLLDTGCRRGGCVKLKMTDIDLEAQTAIVNEKSGERTVWFGPETARALQEWFDMRAQWLIQEDKNLADIYVFNRYGKQMQPGALGQVVRRVCLKAGCKSRGTHSFRHRLGHMLQKHTDPQTAAQVLGHHNPHITLAYYYTKDTSEAAKVARELSIPAPDEDETPKLPTERDEKIILFPQASNG